MSNEYTPDAADLMPPDEGCVVDLDAIARNAVIEECAKACDAVGLDWDRADDYLKYYAAQYLASHLRSLKSTPPAQ